MSKPKITFAQYEEAANTLEIKMGAILSVETFKENKPHVYKMQVEFAMDGTDTRTVITSIGNDYPKEKLVGELFPFITNLEPVKQYGILSEAMIVVPTRNGEFLPTFMRVGATLM